MDLAKNKSNQANTYMKNNLFFLDKQIIKYNLNGSAIGLFASYTLIPVLLCFLC